MPKRRRLHENKSENSLAKMVLTKSRQTKYPRMFWLKEKMRTSSFDCIFLSELLPCS